jgi:hypothetical protein
MVGIDEIGGTDFEPRVFPPDQTAAQARPSRHVLADAMAAFIRMPQRLRRVVQWRFEAIIGDGTPTYQQIGRRLGITKQAVESLHRRAIREWPALAALFAGKTRRRRTSTGR